jgi:hypothetical protein
MWPADLSGLDGPGLYSWWVDEGGADDLSQGLGQPVRVGRIYAGQTGATKWPSGKTGKATLRTRIGNNHLKGRIRGSTFRLTLGAALQRRLELQSIGTNTMAADSEHRLSRWIADHLDVAVFPFQDADALANLEHRVLRVLDPPLNLDGMDITPLRAALRALRASLAARVTSPSLATTIATPIARSQAVQPASDLRAINSFIQAELRRRQLREAPALVVAQWLDDAKLLRDSAHRPGLPLRKLLRTGQIKGAEQRPPQPNGRWFVTRIAE